MRVSRMLAGLVLPGVLYAQTWYQMPVTVPPTAVAFDAARHRLLIACADTQQRMYEWDGIAAHERQDELVGQRVVQHLVWDPVRRRMLAVAEDAWVGTWDGGGWSWYSGLQPGTTSGWSVAFDERRQRLVAVASTAVVNEWDGQQWWAIGTGPNPLVTVGAAFAYDPVSQRCVLHGGAAARTMSWDGFAWTTLQSAGPPGPRGRAGLAFDPNRQRLVLCGGSATATDTWEWTGATWSQVPTTNDPGAHLTARLVADDTGMLLVATSGPTTGELWRLTGNTWTKVGFLPPGPNAQPNTVFAYDHARDELVGFNSDQTLRFGRRWLQATPTVRPPSRTQALIAWSSLGQRVLLFGGIGNPTFGDTWTWNGSDWEARQPAHSPPARYGALMVEDPAGGVLLFGGTDGPNWFGDHWSWDGVDWLHRTPAVVPASRAYMSGAYDPLRAQVVLAGGYTTTASYLGETWTWDGANWTLRPTTVVPLPGTASFRPETGRVVVVGQTAHEWTGSDWVAVPGVTLGQAYTFNAPRLATHFARGELLLLLPPVVRELIWLRADTEPYGTSCSLGPPPALAAIDAPEFGAGFAIELTGRAAAAPSFLVVGLAAQNVDLGAGCRSLVGLPLAVNFALGNAGGIARWPIPIPSDPALRGVRFTAQGAAWNPAGSPLGSVTLTAGLLVTIGD